MAVGVRYAHPRLDEVGESKNPIYMRIFLWEGHILASRAVRDEMIW